MLTRRLKFRLGVRVRIYSYRVRVELRTRVEMLMHVMFTNSTSDCI